MMFCSSCGAQMPDGAKFCKHCGKPLSQRPAPSQPQKTSAYAKEAPRSTARNAKTASRAAQNTAKTAAKTGKAAGKAAKAGKAGIGLGTKLAVVAAAGGLAYAAASGVFEGGGGGGDGGGTYKPPVIQQENGSTGNTSGGTTGNTSGGTAGKSQDLSGGGYYIWETYSPDSNHVETVLVRIDENGSPASVSYVYRDGEEEEMFNMNGSTSSGRMSTTVSDEDGVGTIDVSRNSDGSYSGMLTSDSEDGYARTYTKLVPVIKSGDDSWIVPATGETLSYDKIVYDELEGTALADEFLKEASSQNNTFVEYESESSGKETFVPSLATPRPSSGNNSVTIPDDVMRVYVTYEVENIEHEYNGVKVPNHIKMPNVAEQQRFEALIMEELNNDREEFWLAHKDEWYK